MIDNPFSIHNKTILVTGASSGIGRGCAIILSRQGANVIISGRNKEKLLSTLSEMEGDGHKMVLADLSLQENITKLAEECPILDGYLHSAGILKLCTTKSVNRQILEESFNTNVQAPIMLTNALLRKKKLKSKSSIVYISSLSGVFIGGTGEISYSATKGALSGYMKTAALEL